MGRSGLHDRSPEHVSAGGRTERNQGTECECADAEPDRQARVEPISSADGHRTLLSEGTQSTAAERARHPPTERADRSEPAPGRRSDCVTERRRARSGRPGGAPDLDRRGRAPCGLTRGAKRSVCPQRDDAMVGTLTALRLLPERVAARGRAAGLDARRADDRALRSPYGREHCRSRPSQRDHSRRRTESNGHAETFEDVRTAIHHRTVCLLQRSPGAAGEGVSPTKDRRTLATSSRRGEAIFPARAKRSASRSMGRSVLSVKFRMCPELGTH